MFQACIKAVKQEEAFYITQIGAIKWCKAIEGIIGYVGSFRLEPMTKMGNH